ncbi:high-potential iron-sulfur protein [Dyella nitratireducens]|uniref:high-potential iron-sulfur protein n=1 Tax=Dyella nitratireducens TaxID=1849580 RepID=UPI00166A40AA|nr:high-potential iron-sulfur protein [Dyella nitratireducens]GLQ42157.1 high-potential iron-sulfur protein [Dyella nitratireducens]
MSQSKEPTESRRRFLQLMVVSMGSACAGGVSLFARAGELPHLTDADPTAKVMNYVDDATSSKHALYKAGSICANCQFYHGPDAGYGTCQLFPGKAVNAKGWCSSYTPKKG